LTTVIITLRRVYEGLRTPTQIGFLKLHLHWHNVSTKMQLTAA